MLVALKNSTLLLCYLLLIGGTALKRCAREQGGGQCPDDNTCCRISDGNSGCIPSDLGADNATCCSTRGGCGVGYACVGLDTCQAPPSITDPLVQTLPQYQLCQLHQNTTIHEFPMGANNNHATLPSLAYYSSHGDVSMLEEPERGVRRAKGIIVVHGSERNADDYLCSLLAHHRDDETTVIIAPWFAACSDGSVTDTMLCWDVIKDPNGPWRYGADATRGVGSFDAMDHLVSHLLTKVEQLTLVGHSSGGQFVQRWSLLTPVWDNRQTRAIVANPSSYAYLSPERHYDGQWQQPKADCDAYNQWEWGLDLANWTIDKAPYVASILQSITDDVLIDRFRARQMIYLIGGQDQCTGHAWCDSHGLETLCQDQLQGYNRLERQNRYLAHLGRMDVPFEHHVVPAVGHDHSLMFNSAIGRQVIFGDKVPFRNVA